MLKSAGISTPVSVANGGTGLASFTANRLICSQSTSTLSGFSGVTADDVNGFLYLANVAFGFAVEVFTTGASVSASAFKQLHVVKKGTGSATAVSLPSPSFTGEVHIVKDGKGDAAANNITITPTGKTVDGAASIIINANYGSVTLIYNGTEWNAV